MKQEKENIILVKSYAFAVNVTRLILEVRKSKKEYDITRQLLRSATSIGANAEEAVGGFSKKDFIYKLQISFKEARESKYWIRILKDTELLEEKTAEMLLKDIEELIKILTAILKTSKSNNY